MTRIISVNLIAFALVGCTSAPAPTTAERLPLRHLAILYGKYRNAHQGAVPKDEAQFKKFIKSLDPSQLAAAGVSANELDGLFVSPRDGEPYDVRYNNPPPPDGDDGPAAVVMERTGKNGKRMVAYSIGKVDEVDETEYQRIRFKSH